MVLARQPSCPARRPEDKARQGSARRPAEVLQAAEERAPLALPPQAPDGRVAAAPDPLPAVAARAVPTRALRSVPLAAGSQGRQGRAGLTAPEGGLQKGVPLRTPAQARVVTEETEVGVSPLGVRPAGAFAQAAPRGEDLASDLRRGAGLGHGGASPCSESKMRRPRRRVPRDQRARRSGRPRRGWGTATGQSVRLSARGAARAVPCARPSLPTRLPTPEREGVP